MIYNIAAGYKNQGILLQDKINGERGDKERKLILNRHVCFHSPNLRKSLYGQYKTYIFPDQVRYKQNTILTSLY